MVARTTGRSARPYPHQLREIAAAGHDSAASISTSTRRVADHSRDVVDLEHARRHQRAVSVGDARRSHRSSQCTLIDCFSSVWIEGLETRLHAAAGVRERPWPADEQRGHGHTGRGEERLRSRGRPDRRRSRSDRPRRRARRTGCERRAGRSRSCGSGVRAGSRSSIARAAAAPWRAAASQWSLRRWRRAPGRTRARHRRPRTRRRALVRPCGSTGTPSVLEPGPPEPARVRLDPDSHEHVIALHTAAAGKLE